MPTTKRNFKDSTRILRACKAQQIELEILILGTPTGGARNLMTDANIHLLASIGKLEELLS